jgi:hypothetical protein
MFLATLPSRLHILCLEPRCVILRVREEEMLEDLKRQDGESCRKAGDILVAALKLLRSFVIDIDPALVLLLYVIRPCSGRFERSRSYIFSSAVIYSDYLISKQD